MQYRASHDVRTEVREQLRLAVPFVALQVGMMAMGLVDGAFMGRVSAAEYAGVSLGNTYTYLLIIFGMGLLTALDPVVGQAWGAGDRVAIRRGLQRGLLLAVLVSVPISLAMLPVRAVLELSLTPMSVELIPFAGPSVAVKLPS